MSVSYWLSRLCFICNFHQHLEANGRLAYPNMPQPWPQQSPSQTLTYPTLVDSWSPSHPIWRYTKHGVKTASLNILINNQSPPFKFIQSFTLHSFIVSASNPDSVMWISCCLSRVITNDVILTNKFICSHHLYTNDVSNSYQ